MSLFTIPLVITVPALPFSGLLGTFSERGILPDGRILTQGSLRKKKKKKAADLWFRPSCCSISHLHILSPEEAVKKEMQLLLHKGLHLISVMRR